MESVSKPPSTPESLPASGPLPASEPSPAPETAASRILAAYSSAAGNTKAVAETIAESMEAGLYEPVPDPACAFSDGTVFK